MSKQTCIHGKEETDTCFHCASTGVYSRQDACAYAEIYKRSGSVSFELAFELKRRVERWKEGTKSLALEFYFKEIGKNKKIGWGINSLKQAYYVAMQFPELDKAEKQKCSFTVYREIANADLSDDQKNEIRTRTETEGLTTQKVRRIIQSEYKNRNSQEVSESIKYHSDQDFLKKVQEFIAQHEVEPGRCIMVTLKYIKERRSTAKN